MKIKTTLFSVAERRQVQIVCKQEPTTTFSVIVSWVMSEVGNKNDFNNFSSNCLTISCTLVLNLESYLLDLHPASSNRSIHLRGHLSEHSMTLQEKLTHSDLPCALRYYLAVARHLATFIFLPPRPGERHYHTLKL